METKVKLVKQTGNKCEDCYYCKTRTDCPVWTDGSHKCIKNESKEFYKNSMIFIKEEK